VPEGSEFVGQTLAESGLRERDITVLTLRRGNVVIPNPKESRTLEGEDRLLCFGKLEEMRSMIPTRRKRRAKVRKLLDEALPDADRGSGGTQSVGKEVEAGDGERHHVCGAIIVAGEDVP